MNFEDVKEPAEIIKDRLYFTVFNKRPKNGKDTHFFCIDTELEYEPFFSDFGPLNIGLTWRFCQMLNKILASKDHEDKKIVYYCGNDNSYKSNAAVLIGAYQIIYLQRSAAESYEPLERYEKQFRSFRDASMGTCTFKLMPVHCLRAIEKALSFGWIDFENFDVEEYEYFECVENGDLNTIIPDVFIAFATPYSDGNGIDGYPTLTPENYFPIWKKYDVRTIIRLNKAQYDKKRFTKAGYIHHDMFFVDGTTPSNKILYDFLKIVETTEEGVIAVHCKAGLGRTGSLIGCYIMKHYKMKAADTIAWIRLCRPGSIIGPQQYYLKHKQQEMWELGASEGLHGKLDKYTLSSPKLSQLKISNSPTVKQKKSFNDSTGAKGEPSPIKKSKSTDMTSSTTEENGQEEEKKT